MKRFLPVLSIAVLSSLSAFGASGTQLIGLSPASVGLGGTGTGSFLTGTDSLYKNPSLLSYVPNKMGGSEVEVYSTFIKLNATANAGAGDNSNQTGVQVLPSLAG